MQIFKDFCEKDLIFFFFSMLELKQCKKITTKGEKIMKEIDKSPVASGIKAYIDYGETVPGYKYSGLGLMLDLFMKMKHKRKL